MSTPAITIPVPRAAAILGISESGAYGHARRGTLPGVRKLGARYTVVLSDLEGYLGMPSGSLAAAIDQGMRNDNSEQDTRPSSGAAE